MDRIRELLRLLANPAETAADELLAARVELAAAFDEWCLTDEALSDEGAALAAEVGATCDAVDMVISERETVMAERRTAMEELRAKVAPTAAGPEDEPETPEVPEGDEPAEADPAPEATTEQPEPELVSAETAPARRVPLSVLSARQPASSKPLPASDEPRGPIITAGVDLNGFSAGAELTAFEAAEAMSEKLRSALMADPGSPPSIMRAGRVSWAHQYPSERKVVKGAPDVADKAFAAVVGAYPGDPTILEPIQRDGNGLIATGGLCAPVTVRYELETVSVADRPLRAGLPSFNADRGGIQFNSPAHLIDILADQGSAALTTTTVAQDAAAGTKTVQEVACGSLNTVQVRAIAERLQFSNFGDRYNPERMQQFMQLARSAHSRLCERELFEDMRNASTLVSGGPVFIGATRQWFGNVLAAGAAQRYRHRMDDAYPLRIALPDWFVDVVALDLGFAANGEQGVFHTFDTMAVIAKWLAEENIRPMWYRDDARTNNALGSGAPAFGTQSGSGATLNDFPGNMTSLLFPEGSFLFLDGGALDFGIVRDSTLNAANRFQTFYEVFEGVAFVGVESLQIVTNLCNYGQGIAGTTTAKCGGVGS